MHSRGAHPPTQREVNILCQYYQFIYLQFLQDMKDMRSCCDSLLSAAAATTNSAYGTCSTLLDEKILCSSSCLQRY